MVQVADDWVLVWSLACVAIKAAAGEGSGEVRRGQPGSLMGG